MILYFLISLIDFSFGAIEYSSKANRGFRNVIYYGDWSVWGGQENFYPDAIASSDITHLNFAFLDFDASGVLVYTDAGAAHDNPCGHTGVTYGDANAGVLPAFQDLRANYPNVRLGVSLGGWSKSGDFTTVLKSNTARANLVNQLGKFIEYNNFDFIDVDWEYPGSQRDPDYCDNSHDEGTPKAEPQDGKLFIQFLNDLKAKENELSKKNNRTYELTVALPASVSNFENGAQAYLPSGVTKATATAEQMQTASTEYVAQLFDVIDFGNLMTYDMRGAWDSASGHQTGLYTHLSGNPDIDAVDFSADGLVSYLLGKSTDSKNNRLNRTISRGVLPQKLVIGVAFYTRGWEKVSNDGPEPTKYPGLFGTAAIGGKDADQADSRGANNAAPVTQGDGGRRGGVWPYGRLTQLHGNYTGLKYYYDDIAEAPYFYNEATGAFFTYDSPTSIAAKAAYVRANGLGGIISWMASDDANTGNETHGQYSAGQTRSVLSQAIKTGLWGTTPLDEFNIGAPLFNVSATVSVGTDANTGKGTLNIKVKNNFVNSETTEVLQLSAKVCGSIAVPRVYITLANGVQVGSGTAYQHGTWEQSGNLVTVHFTEFELKTLPPGETLDIQLPTSAATPTVADVLKVEISRQIYPDGKETGRAQVL